MRNLLASLLSFPRNNAAKSKGTPLSSYLCEVSRIVSKKALFSMFRLQVLTHTEATEFYGPSVQGLVTWAVSRWLTP